MMTFDTEGKDQEQETAQEGQGQAAEAEATDQEEQEERPTEGPVPASRSSRRLARELEVDLEQVPPSGPGGRVTAEDVKTFAEQKERAPDKEKEHDKAKIINQLQSTRTSIPKIRPIRKPLPNILLLDL
jgi:pyruvate dehydrogenase E2 component (dihydrolipoamide acetyltransferase)